MIITVDTEKEPVEGLRRAAKLLMDAAANRDGSGARVEAYRAVEKIVQEEPFVQDIPAPTVLPIAPRLPSEPPQPKKAKDKDALPEGIQLY